MDATNCTIGKNTSAISFEGFYINENILGLVNTLSKRLNRGCSVQKPNPIPSMGNYFSNHLYHLAIQKQSNLILSCDFMSLEIIIKTIE